mgnify:CR=1|jgi:hypothetical protein
MATDLFKIYKSIAQRFRQDPSNYLKLEMKDLARDLVKQNLTREEMTIIGEKLYELEVLIPSVQTFFSKKILDAVESGNYLISVPFQVLHSWNERAGDEGYVYIATSVSKPGQVKLGATSYSPEYRLKKYEYKYGYPIRVYWKVRTGTPFSLEKKIARSVKAYRVAGLTNGDSNEWYEIAPQHLKEEIEKLVR